MPGGQAERTQSGVGTDLPGGLPDPFWDLTADLLPASFWDSEPDETPDEVWEELAALAELPAAEHPSERLADGLQAAERWLESARVPANDMPQVFSPSLAPALAAVDRLRTETHRIAVQVLVEALDRGLPAEGGLSVIDWLRLQMPGLTMSETADLVAVAKYAAAPHGGPVRGAVEAGAPLARLAKVSRALDRVAGVLTHDERVAYGEIAAGAVRNPAVSEHGLGLVCRKLLEDLLNRRPQEQERVTNALRSVTVQPLGPGMTRFTVDAPETEATVIKQLLASNLTKPRGSGDTGSEPDERTPTQRHFDALMEVLHRGLAHPGAEPSTAPATVILTMPFDPERRQPAGPALTSTGEPVPWRVAERISCSAEIVPIWLGPGGEPLDVGRAARLATPSQRAALFARDQGCTYPGCSRPPQWCHAHHIDFWERGGRTDLNNLALLCQRHHTIVHQRDLTATVAGGTVRWHI